MSDEEGIASEAEHHVAQFRSKLAEDPGADAYNSYKIHRTITVVAEAQYPKDWTLDRVIAAEEELDDVMVSIDGDDDNEVKVTNLRVEHG
jgi:hypothetical protein